MEAPRGGLVVEQLTGVRHRAGFEELAGLSQGRPVSVGVTDAGLFPDEASTAAFGEAVRGAMRVQHRHVAATLAIEWASPGRWAVFWERFEGQGLDMLLADRGSLSPDEAVSITIAVAQAVAAGHELGVLHGGVSPEWVTIVPGPQGLDTRVAGFGLGLLPGFTGGKKATIASDIHSIASLLHQLLTGEGPQGRVGKLPPNALHLGAVVAKGLGLDVSGRFRSVAEFETALVESNRTHVSGGRVLATQPIARPGGIAPRTLGPWELVSLLGEGAMGQVFLAKHTLLGRQAAIKVLRPEQYQREDLIQRFFQEARSVNQINHEHIVEISDFGQELGPDGKPSAVYFVMELLQGETLTARLAHGKLSIARALHVIRQLCEALGAAHRLGVVHRDVKSDNVFLIKRQGDDAYVKVLDFGVAKLTQPTAAAPTVSTMDGAIIGTPTSMSPEQASGGVVDHRADVYAVGVLLYQMLAGKLPIDAENFGKLIALLLTRPPEPLPEKNPLGEPIPPELAAVVMRCLEKDPARRPQSMAELIEALAEPPKLDAPPSRRWPVIGAVLALVAVVGVAVVVLKPEEKTAPLPPPVATTIDAAVPEPEVIDAGPVAVAEVLDAGAAADEASDAGAQVAGAEPDAGAASPRPVVKVKPVPLTPAVIQDAFAKQTGSIESCVRRYRPSFPPEAGVLKVRFTVAPAGAVSRAEIVAPALPEGEVKKCLVSAVRSIKFPRNLGPEKTAVMGINYR